MIELGSVVKDKITGLMGVATCRCTYLHDAVSYGVTPLHGNKDNTVVWFQESRLEVDKNVIKYRKDGVE